MATNLVSLVMQFLTPEISGVLQLHLVLIAPWSNQQLMLRYLACWRDLVELPPNRGPAKARRRGKTRTGTLGQFADMLGGGGQSNFIERGSQSPASLLGARDQSALVSAIGQFAGLAQGKSGSLLGMLAPIVMGTVAQQQGAQGLNASGIANLFASQKDNIAAALPADFGRLLGGTDLLNSLGGAARFGALAGTQATRTAASAAGNAGQRAAAAATSYNSALLAHPHRGDSCALGLLPDQTGGAGCRAAHDHRAKSNRGRDRRQQTGHRQHC